MRRRAKKKPVAVWLAFGYRKDDPDVTGYVADEGVSTDESGARRFDDPRWADWFNEDENYSGWVFHPVKRTY